MAQSRSSAGQRPVVLFPRSTSDLTSTTQCPACFTVLAGSVCSRCGLDLGNPAAVELAKVSAAAAASLDRRLQLIAQIRAAHDAAAAANALAPVSDTTAPSPTTRPAAPEVSAASSPLAGPDNAPNATPRRHLGAQVILLIVGVSLLSVGAIFFLVYAFITFGLVWRSLIIAAVTILSIVAASVLRRRRLAATAEAISVLAIVFVYLDVFAVRANDFFGSAAANGLTYWGSCLAVAAVAFVAWRRASGLRIPQLVAAATFGPGLALLVGGVTEPLPDSTRAFAAFAALGASTLVHPLPLRAASGWLAERRISAMVSWGGLVAALALGPVIAPEWVWAPAIALGIVVVIAAAVVAVMSRVGAPRLPAVGIAAIGGLAASVAALAVAVRASDFAVAIFWAPVISVAVTLGLDLVRRWGAGRVSRPALAAAAWSSAAVTAAILLLPLATALGPVATLVAGGAERWRIPGGAVTELSRENYAAVLALAAVCALAVVWWLLSRKARGRMPIALWSGAVTLVLAAPLLGQLWLTVLAWLAIAGASLAVLTRFRQSAISRRLPFAATTVAAGFLAYASSWASIDTWWYGSVGVVLLLVLVRIATSSVAARTLSLALAVALSFVAIGSEGWHTNERFFGGADAALDSLHFVGALAAALLIVGALLARRLSRSEGRVMFWMAFAVAAAASALSWLVSALGTGPRAVILGEFGTSVVLGAATIVGLLVWVVLGSTRDYRVERVAAAAALAPAFGWLVDSIFRASGAPDWAQSLAPVSSAVVVSAASRAVSIVRPGPVPRWAPDIGAALVAAITLAAHVIAPSESTWLILILAGVAIVVIAVSRDGLIDSHSPRRYLGWLALALATAGLWLRLGRVGVSDVEPYVLPVAGVVLIVALLLQRSAGRAANPAAAGIAFTGLALAVIPTAVVAINSGTARAIAITAVSAALCVVSAIRGRGGLREYQDAAALVGIVGATVTAFGRAADLSLRDAPAGPIVDAWIAAGFAVVVVSAVIQSRVPERQGLRRIISQILLVSGIVVFSALELSIIADDALGALRAALVLAVLGVIHVIGIARGTPPATAVAAWISTGVGVVVAVFAVARGALDPAEWAAAAVALPLLVAGSVRLARNPSARSWPWLAPGLAALLVPSLVASFSEQPLWRLVGLGVACIVAIVIGALVRLQAPLMLGAVIVLVHAARTFAPQIIAVYQLTQWWVWAVIGGAIVLFIGITFEKRLRDLRSAGTRLAELR